MRLVGSDSPSCFEYVLPLRLGVRISSSSSSSGSKRLILAEWPWTLPLSELRGRLRGVRAPERLVRLMGRGGGCISVLLVGRAMPDDMLARELGREMETSDSPLGPLLGSGPKDSLLTPEVLSRGICLEPDCMPRRPWAVLVGVASSLITDELATELGPRFLERIVTEEGIGTPPRPLIEPAGDTLGGVFTRAGSLERAV